MNADDAYILKLLSLNIPLAKIAAKLGISTLQIEKRIRELQQEAEDNSKNGYYALCNSFTTLCNQYELVGESLKLFGGALGALMSDDDLLSMLTGTPDEILRRLKSKAIVLRPWVPPPLPAKPENQ